MAWTRPTLAALINRILSDIQGQLEGTNPWLRRMMLRVLGTAQGGAVHGLYGHQVYLSQQIAPDTADETWLPRWAAIWGVPRKAATAAQGPVVCTGTNGTLVPAQTLLTSATGIEYAVNSDAQIADGAVQVAVTATTTGDATNLAAGGALTFVSPLANVASSATVDAAGITGGADVEDIDEWRLRLMARIQQPPQAGTVDDYVRWAKEVAGVTRAWVFPRELAANGVSVRFAMDDATTGPIPDATTIAAVQVQLDALCPATAVVTVVAPVATPLNPTIKLIPDTQALRDSVTDELTDLLVREGAPGGTLLLTHIEEAISSALGSGDYVLSSPLANVVYTNGQLPVLGAVTWQ